MANVTLVFLFPRSSVELLTIDSDACIRKIVRNYNKEQNLVDSYDTLRKSQHVFVRHIKDIKDLMEFLEKVST